MIRHPLPMPAYTAGVRFTVPLLLVFLGFAFSPGCGGTGAVEAPTYGIIGLNGDDVPILDVRAIWDEPHGELHLYCFSFPLTKEDRSASPGVFSVEAVKMSREAARNPNPKKWFRAPYIVFQFGFDDPSGMLTLQTVSHSRFIAWIQEAPTTLNWKDEEAIAHFTTLEIIGEGGTRKVSFDSDSTAAFFERNFSWSVHLADLPVERVTKN